MSNMNEDVEELFAFYAMGTLSTSEKAQVEAYVASRPEARDRLNEMIGAVSALPHMATPMQPSAALKESLMDRIRADARSRSAAASRSRADSRPRFGFGSGLAYAVAVFSLLVAFGVGMWGLSVRNEVARLRGEVAVLQQQVQMQRTVLAQLSSPHAELFAISGTEHDPQAKGQLIADPSTGSAVLVVSGLKSLAAGMTYEFWLIKDDKAAPAGLFKVGEQGQAVLQVSQSFTSDAYNTIGVSIEPDGGSQSPTGDIVMLAKLNQ